MHFISAVESKWIVGPARQLGEGWNIEEMGGDRAEQFSGWGTILWLFALVEFFLGLNRLRL